MLLFLKNFPWGMWMCMWILPLAQTWVLFICSERVCKKMFILRIVTEWKRLNRGRSFNIKKINAATSSLSLMCYSKEHFLQLDRTGTQVKGDTFEVNEGKSLHCDSLSLRSLTAEGSKLSSLTSGKKLMSLVENILDCIAATQAWLTTASSLNKMC